MNIEKHEKGTSKNIEKGRNCNIEKHERDEKHEKICVISPLCEICESLQRLHSSL